MHVPVSKLFAGILACFALLGAGCATSQSPVEVEISQIGECAHVAGTYNAVGWRDESIGTTYRGAVNMPLRSVASFVDISFDAARGKIVVRHLTALGGDDVAPAQILDGRCDNGTWKFTRKSKGSADGTPFEDVSDWSWGLVDGADLLLTLSSVGKTGSLFWSKPYANAVRAKFKRVQ